jgi:hypothetical protein
VRPIWYKVFELVSLVKLHLFCVAVDNWLHCSVVGGEVRKLKALG